MWYNIILGNLCGGVLNGKEKAEKESKKVKEEKKVEEVLGACLTC
jgi:hypothetical protein